MVVNGKISFVKYNPRFDLFKDGPIEPGIRLVGYVESSDRGPRAAVWCRATEYQLCEEEIRAAKAKEEARARELAELRAKLEEADRLREEDTRVREAADPSSIESAKNHGWVKHITTNGQIIMALKDEDGKILKTKTFHSPAHRVKTEKKPGVKGGKVAIGAA
jgi:hypothetical protein